MDNITAIIVVGIVLAFLMMFYVVARMYRKVGPNQALIVFGFGGTRIVTGGGTVVWPMVQTARELSLELMSFDVAPKQDLYTVQGVAVTVEAVAQIKVKSDPESITTAAEQFLNKENHEREALIRLVMEGHLRGIVGQLTVEAIVKEPEMVSGKMRSTCAEDLSKMGLEVVSFTIREVRDQNEYISNMGRPDVARIRRDADVATAEADRDTAIKRAVYMRESAQARAQADMERVAAETASAAKQAEAVRDLEVKKADYAAVVSRQKAQADKAYDIQTNVQMQQVMAEQIRIDRVQKEEQIQVQEAEILRREKELFATVLKPAEVERQKIQQLAEAERQRLSIEATGRAEATRLEAQGQADAIRATGLAEADAIKAKGFAEAEAMNVKASAFQEYNQAFVIDKLLTSLPEVARAMSEPLRNVDKITVLSTGDGEATGMNKVTNDIGKMIVQIPALFETLAGVSLPELLKQVPAIGTAMVHGKGHKSKTADSSTDSSTPPASLPAED
ncbi:flotillin [candidate division BRC1 bacterium HGW-BRC1-1]|jgi:flotillin|nr:MAG: flotillin [candidate division BRC1 bacterium HGW-BRC1-1]